MRRKTTEEFIQKASAIHNGKYDYSKVDYKRNKTKVCIICPIHGEFWQTPDNHLHYGCIKCGGTYKMDTKSFIEKARRIHGDKYNYDKVEYKTTEQKVIITCPIHEDFIQTPHDHISGHGCPMCGGVFTYTTESFIEAAKKVHGDLYLYDKVDYKHSDEKVIITCSKHGDFEQVPAAHLSGVGCPRCKRSRGEEIISLILDELNIEYKEQYSIDIDSEIRNKFVVGFYIPSKNCIIEFNGEQHYKAMEFFGGEVQLHDQQKRDNELREYCEHNGIKLIEIPYYEKDIKKIIETSLQ